MAMMKSLIFNFLCIATASAGELGPGGSPRSEHAPRLYERLQRYLQIAYQQGPHISSGTRTHDLVDYEPTPYQLDHLCWLG
ncbi:hypothetical protein PIB30_038678 [Stylosanthes scabra]|uniref:Uncharacterized protein n=1 Tax=Stylosanthes scabra TaxID=79078 RepID=A0ABU6YCX8_9FABA|nr:hypothetical protein [Stylosanthes scabra]